MCFALGLKLGVQKAHLILFGKVTIWAPPERSSPTFENYLRNNETKKN
jgi:hypothetical protein